jgi:hypothetical protein
MLAIGCLAPLVLLVVGGVLGGYLGGTHGGDWGAALGAGLGLVVLLAGMFVLGRARGT